MSDYEPSRRGGSDELIGTVLSSRYRLEEQIGSGGMGTVWKAADTLLNRPVAVKLLHLSQMAEPTSRQRFRTEGRITAGLSHPGIAQVYDYGEEDGRAFLIMELVVGAPLSELLRDQGHLNADETLDLVCQASQALAAAHARGVVHRDIKPGNLLVTPKGRLKLTDFGIARGDMSVTLTQTGMVMGTAQYISPEQASGKPASAASDLYALGVVAYECLAGQPPFTGDNPVALALAHTRDEPPELPEHVPPEVDDLVSALLLKDPEERPASASEVAHMAAVLRSHSGAGPPTPASGVGPLARTAVVSAVPDTDGVRRTAGRRVLASDQREDSARLAGTSNWRGRLPVVLVAVAATAIVAAAMMAGLLSGDPSGSEPVGEVSEDRSPVEVSSPDPSGGDEENASLDPPNRGGSQQEWPSEPDGPSPEGESPAPEGEQTGGTTGPSGEPTGPGEEASPPDEETDDPVPSDDPEPDPSPDGTGGTGSNL
ncbi:protein kinase domain-containing protein [Nocardiopsis sp. LOL_012]|uniref:serine/threonine-protein kinase n=1 Tax=Nocardiopsis sp. LOL_012 TaxID=3345409 RepID=UPI003A8A0632